MRLHYLLLSLALTAGVAFAQQPPPGSDPIGSDHHVQQGQSNQQLSNNPRQNSEITGNTGDSHGNTATRGFAGESGADERSNKERDSAGQSGETGANAARRNTAQRNREEKQHGIKPGDNGSVWHANTIRDSNIVAKQTGAGIAKDARQGGTGGSDQAGYSADQGAQAKQSKAKQAKTKSAHKTRHHKKAAAQPR